MVAWSLKMNKLDFLIIGAQKSGTTTLFKILSEHPDIHMPSGKEAPFFTKDVEYSKGLQSYTKEFFSRASDKQLWGTATPHYLSDPRAPSRIFETVPDVKLIVILREPADRALSHYRMSVRRELDKRTFEDAIEDMLQADALNDARELITGQLAESQTYIVWGEYGRLITKYLELFPAENLLILFTVELEKKPEEVIQKVLTFLGLSDYKFNSIGKKFHQGGTKERLPFIKALKRFSLIKRMWRSLTPEIRSKILYAVNQLNTVKSSDSLSNYDQTVINLLHEHYGPDITKLEEITGYETPWKR